MDGSHLSILLNKAQRSEPPDEAAGGATTIPKEETNPKNLV